MGPTGPRIHRVSSYRIKQRADQLTHTPAPYAAWQFEREIPYNSPFTADHDANGRADLLDYALTPEPDGLTRSAIVRNTNNDPHLSLSFLRARAELTYEVEAGPDLAAWAVIATNPGSVGADVTVTDPDPLPVSGRRFLRLRVH